jgi:hypothetical protein
VVAGASDRIGSPVAAETTARSELSAPGPPSITVTKLCGGASLGTGFGTGLVTGGRGCLTLGIEAVPRRP